jgi:very-short-patch-repair endonuclease
MRHLPPHLADTISARHGVVARHELLDAGWSRHRITSAVASGELIVCHPGVYRINTSAETFESRCAAACLADPTLVVTGRSAARLWRFRHIGYDGPPIVLTDHDRNPVSGDVIIRRTNVLERTDWIVRADGIVITNPVRTWFDCARDVSDETFEAVTEWVLDRHTSVPNLWAMVRRMDARGRPGLARVRRVMSQRSDWQRPAGSKLELRVLRALRAAGVPELVRQHPIRLPNGLIIHPDAADPTLRWALEVDHITWHGGRVDAQRDKGRDRGLRRIRWQVERVTDQELRDDFGGTIRDIAELYFLRRQEFAA